MSRIKLALAVLLAATVVLTAAPANAEEVVIHDPKGDASSYDIDSVTVKHREERVRFHFHADRTPYGYHAFIDVPGGRNWEYVVTWAVYTPSRLSVLTPKQFRKGGGAVCRLKTGKETTIRDVEYAVPTRCFGDPAKLRVKAKGWDDEAGYTDTTAWSKWANRG